MSAGIIITGYRDVDAKLASLPDKVQKKIARKALSKAMALLRKDMRARAPRGPTGNLVKSIRSRFKRRGKPDSLGAKVGINVGKRTAEAVKIARAPHGHLVALGTQERFHKTGKAVGRMTPNPFVRLAYEAKRSQCQGVMADFILSELNREVSKRP